MIAAIGVVVPVANEERLLPACLDAIATARTELAVARPDVAVRVVTVLDACTDASPRIAAAAGVEIVTVCRRIVGAVRRAGCTHLLATGADPRQTWLASTDADSQVPPDWLMSMADLACAGADLVLGTVAPGDGLPADAADRYRSGYVFDDGHPHVHGANLGIRADAYELLGGWAELATHEDVDLARRATDAGLRVVSTARIPVVTSTRLTGRAPGGFSSHLRGVLAGRSAVPRHDPTHERAEVLRGRVDVAGRPDQ